MKNKFLLFAFLLTGCMTQRKAVNYMNAHGYEAASYCAAAFPIKDSIGKPTTKYKPAQNTDYTKKMDSLKHGFDDQLKAFKDAQKQQANDTSCLRTIQALQAKYECLFTSYDSLRAKYKPCKPDTAYIEVPHFIEITAKTTALQTKLDKQSVTLQSAETGRSNWRKWCLWTWGIILIGGSLYLFVKNKISFLTGLISKIKL